MKTKNQKKIMKAIGWDNWGRQVFQDENGRIFKKVKEVKHVFYSVTQEGEPDSPLRKSIEVLEVFA